MKVTEIGLPIRNRLDSLPSRRDSRKHPRVLLTLPVECRLMNPEKCWPGRPLQGEITDVSIGGAKVWLPQRLPLFQAIEVTALIGGRLFRARGEIVGADTQAQKDVRITRCRHSLRWVLMDAHSKDTLSCVVPVRGSEPGKPG
jgi:hypothetical protein